MSREFGSCESGYFHVQMDNAASDCRHGLDKLTRLWGEFLETFSLVAYAIATSEAGDSGPAVTVIATLNAMDDLKRKLRDIERYVDVFDRVAKMAVEDAMKKAKEATRE